MHCELIDGSVQLVFRDVYIYISPSKRSSVPMTFTFDSPIIPAEVYTLLSIVLLYQ